ncbi:MAG: galactokinase [Leptospira sp.]|nr:galactokinase [Leptospira sp.]
MDTNSLFTAFKMHFPSQDSPIRHFSAPARINIIGEHVDYLGGIVLPAAIDFSIHVLIQKNQSSHYHLYSMDYEQQTSAQKPFVNSKEFPWSDYILGVILEIEKKGLSVPGFNLLIKGNIPQGAGLSSSAALEVAVAYAIHSLFDFNLSREEIALIGQAAENHFVGTKCGIMDQFIIALGKKDHCISLNTENLKYTYHEFDLKDYEFYLINSNVKHSLKDSEYNERRKECESALKKIQSVYPEVPSLYDFPNPKKIETQLNSAEYKRLIHVTSERIRTESVISNLKNGEFQTVGKLLYECHWSLSKNFEVSCSETDFIVTYLESKGVIGARMIGGGFGGCVLVLDKKENFALISQELVKIYTQKFKYPVNFYKFKISDGVKEIG